MKIRFTDVNGTITELEISTDYEKSLVVDVSTEIGTFYQESYRYERSNERKNSRIDRRSSLSKLEDFLFHDADGKPSHAKRYVAQETQFEKQLMQAESIAQIMTCLNDRQKYLITRCVLEQCSYAEIAQEEGTDESAIRHAMERARKKLKKFLK